MKNFLTVLFFIFVLMVANSQVVFNEITVLDKFDDVLRTDTRKTLITKTDTTFVVEEKGKAPVTYYILNTLEAGCSGDRDNPVNLTGNVYGYQKTWCVVRLDMVERFQETVSEYYNYPSEENLEKVSQFWLFVTLRTVTTMYGTYIREYFWVVDESNIGILGKGVNRIIYTKE